MGLIVLKLNQQMVTGGQGYRECFFLGVHGVEGEQASGHAQSGDQGRRLRTRAPSWDTVTR